MLESIRRLRGGWLIVILQQFLDRVRQVEDRMVEGLEGNVSDADDLLPESSDVRPRQGCDLPSLVFLVILVIRRDL